MTVKHDEIDKYFNVKPGSIGVTDINLGGGRLTHHTTLVLEQEVHNKEHPLQDANKTCMAWVC